jgi:endonuclease/exonuclease/phosphatase family metal-dependent hydrolase
VESLRTLSLNLRFGLADDGPNGWEYRKKAVVKIFRKLDPDIIATQEANHFQVDYLAEALSGYRYIGRRPGAPYFWQDNILFFKETINCRREDHFFLSHTPDVPSRSFGSHFPRQATIGIFERHRCRFICVNTHFDFDTPAQLGAAQVITERLRTLDSEMPVILMGDFNATPESPCYQWLTSDGNANGGDFRETFTAPYPSTFHRFTGQPVAGYIDWILYRGPLVLESCRVEQEPVETVYPSDHHPVTAVFGCESATQATAGSDEGGR